MILIARHADGKVSKWELDVPTEQFEDARKEVRDTIVSETGKSPQVVLVRIK